MSKVAMGRLLLIMNLLWLSILLPQDYGEDKKIVKCYDRYSNEIMGLDCYTSPTFPSYEYKFWTILIGTIYLNIIGGFLAWKS